METHFETQCAMLEKLYTGAINSQIDGPAPFSEMDALIFAEVQKDLIDTLGYLRAETTDPVKYVTYLIKEVNVREKLPIDHNPSLKVYL